MTRLEQPPTTLPQHLTVAERIELGLAARRAVPIAELADHRPDTGRRDPVEILQEQAVSRVPELVPIRYGRMLATPFSFYRGAAAVMAADLADTPVSGFRVQLCGDAHVSNFGLFASPERQLLFDINDFDETYPGPWEWDVKRLVASLEIAAQANGLAPKVRRNIVRGAARRYRSAMADFAAMRELDLWYAKLDTATVEGLVSKPLTKAQLKRLNKTEAKARSRSSVQAFAKLTHLVDGQPRFIATPPLVVPIADLLQDHDREALTELISGLLRDYRATLPSDRQALLDRFRFIDMARKVVGVGSVGTRCWIVLLAGRDETDPLILQVKEAQRSVLADRLPLTMDTFGNQGERVVSGQRLMQAASDIFLGWQSAVGVDGQHRDFYVRQLHDWKGSIETGLMQPAGLAAIAEICAWTLARAHARSGDRIAIAAYLGDGEQFADAMGIFAADYAERNDRDHAALAVAGHTGRVQVESGI